MEHLGNGHDQYPDDCWYPCDCNSHPHDLPIWLLFLFKITRENIATQLPSSCCYDLILCSKPHWLLPRLCWQIWQNPKMLLGKKTTHHQYGNSSQLPFFLRKNMVVYSFGLVKITFGLGSPSPSCKMHISMQKITRKTISHVAKKSC